MATEFETFDPSQFESQAIRDQLHPTEGLSQNTSALPGLDGTLEQEGEESTLYEDQEEMSWVQVPDNHGFPLNPLAILEQRLDEVDEEEEIDRAFYAQFAPDEELAKGPKTEKGEDGEIIVILDEDIEGDEPLTYDELISPLSREQIREAKKKKAAAGEYTNGSAVKFRTEIRVFRLGTGACGGGGKGDDDDDDEFFYDYEKDRLAYQALCDDILNGRARLGFEERENIAGTGDFKVIMKVVYEEAAS